MCTSLQPTCPARHKEDQKPCNAKQCTQHDEHNTPLHSPHRDRVTAHPSQCTINLKDQQASLAFCCHPLHIEQRKVVSTFQSFVIPPMPHSTSFRILSTPRHVLHQCRCIQAGSLDVVPRLPSPSRQQACTNMSTSISASSSALTSSSCLSSSRH